DTVVIDVKSLTSIADYMIITSGRSTRHVKSIADHVLEAAKKQGIMPIGVEGEQGSEWVLVDLGDIIVHAMLPAVREYYQLEKLWS
ncbi:MAG: ribosome silencing factor, partial [Gammaproteobacteria bacterium]